MRRSPLRLGVVPGVVLILAAGGCRREPTPPSDPPTPTELPEPEPLPALADDCEGRTAGWLSASDGQLVFWPADASPEHEGEVVRPIGEAGPRWSPRSILLRRGTDEWFSTLLPGRAGSLLAVRTTYGEQHVEGRDELVELDAHTLAARVVWAPGRRLLLLGRTGDRVALLAYDGVVARVVAVEFATGAIVESAPVELELDALALRPDALHRSWRLDPSDASNDWSSCRAANDYVLECRGDRRCRARLEGSTITIASVDLEPCPEPDFDEYLPAELGPPVERWRVDQGLPVDGRVVHGVPVELDACLVRANLRFPTREASASEPCRVEIVDAAPSSESMAWFRELFVGPGCTLSTGFAEHAFALPPELVTIEALPERGGWRVELPYPDAAFADDDCMQGDLWLRALDWDRAARSETRFEWEYGFCE